MFRRTRLNTVICSSMTGVGDGSDRALVCSEEDVQRYLEDTRAGFDKSCGNSRLMDWSGGGGALKGTKWKRRLRVRWGRVQVG